MNQKTKVKDSQLRLLIPPSWIAELDTVASVRNFKTRLALIRNYLREQLDLDLARLDEHFEHKEKMMNAKRRTDNWLHERSNREDDDQW